MRWRNLNGPIDILVYSHHRSGGGTPLDALWFSEEACLRRGIRLRFAWTGAPRLGLSALLKTRRVLFDGANAPKYHYGPIIWRLAKLLNKQRAVYWHEMSWIIEHARSSRAVCAALEDADLAHFHVCEAGARELNERYGVSRERIRVLHNLSVAEGWDTYPVPSTVVPGLFVTAGPLQEWKGPDFFVEIASRVLERRPECTFMWLGSCGGGRYAWRAWRERVVAKDVGDRVMFLGQVERPLELMARAEAVLLTSRSEGMPKIAIEALALGKKFVGFDVGGVAEALNGLGRVIPLGDLDGFVKALLDTSDVAAPELCRQRRQRYQEHFTPEAFALRFAEAVQWWDKLICA